MANFWNEWIQDVQAIIIDPERFFSRFKVSGLTESSKFLSVNILISTFLTAVLGVLGLNVFGNKMLGSGLSLLITLPLLGLVFGLIATLIFAGFLQISARLLGGKASYDQTFGVLSAASALNLFTWIPIIGLLIAMYGIHIFVTGFSRVHKLNSIRAFLSMVIALTIIVVIGAAIFFAYLLSSPHSLS